MHLSPQERDKLLIFVAAGILGYGLAFTHYPPNAIVGRGTRKRLNVCASCIKAGKVTR